MGEGEAQVLIIDSASASGSSVMGEAEGEAQVLTLDSAAIDGEAAASSDRPPTPYPPPPASSRSGSACSEAPSESRSEPWSGRSALGSGSD